jgi:hypothetical protein
MGLPCRPSGISGAGRSAKQNLLYSEAAEGINAYGVTRHRHMPEIEQGLSDAAGKPVRVRCVGSDALSSVPVCPLHLMRLEEGGSASRRFAA